MPPGLNRKRATRSGTRPVDTPKGGSRIRRCRSGPVSNGPSPPRRASRVTAGCEARGKAQGPPSRPGVTGEGKTDRVNISELPYASSFKAPTDGMRQRGAGLAAAKRQAPTGGLVPVGRTPPSRGKGSTRPGRTWSVSNVTTPLRSPRSSPARGKPTARKAQFRQRAQDDPEANAGTPKGKDR